MGWMVQDLTPFLSAIGRSKSLGTGSTWSKECEREWRIIQTWFKHYLQCGFMARRECIRYYTPPSADFELWCRLGCWWQCFIFPCIWQSVMYSNYCWVWLNERNGWRDLSRHWTCCWEFRNQKRRLWNFPWQSFSRILPLRWSVIGLLFKEGYIFSDVQFPINRIKTSISSFSCCIS